MDKHYVLLGDVVDSRTIVDRDAFGDRLESSRIAVSEAYGPDLFADPTMLKGIDELGAVLRSIANLYDIILEFTNRAYPNPIRTAVVYGEVDPVESGTDVSRMGGEAFHRGSELLESIEEDRLRFGLSTGQEPLDTAVSDEINLLLSRQEEWTDRQHQVVWRYRKTGSQDTVAGELDMSQQAVSNALKSVSWPFVRTIERRLKATLESYDS